MNKEEILSKNEIMIHADHVAHTYEDETGNVAVDLVCGQPRGEPLANEQPAQKRHRKRLDQPVHHQRDANAPHVLAHFAQRGKVHLHQHGDDHHPDQHTHGQVDLGDFHAPDGLERAGPQLPQPNAHHDAQEHPDGEVALEHAHALGGGRGGGARGGREGGHGERSRE